MSGALFGCPEGTQWTRVPAALTERRRDVCWQCSAVGYAGTHPASHGSGGMPGYGTTRQETRGS